MDTMTKICAALSCDIGDIIEVKSENKGEQK